MIRSSSMHNSQQSSRSAAPWTLPAGQALRLPVGPGGRWLQARSGALWLTRSLPAGGAAVSEDVVLQAGEGLALPGGSEWVLESWGSAPAAFELLVPPSACARRPGGLSRVSVWVRACWQLVSPARRLASAPCPQGSLA
jgi:hypothetical protein